MVLKAVSAGLPHKTEAGAVLVGLEDADAVRAGYAEILANVAKAKPGLTLDGVLVAEDGNSRIDRVVFFLQRD